MLRGMAFLLSAVALALLTPASACRCLPPPPLSDCELRQDAVALLVTIKCVTTKLCSSTRTVGNAVADVHVDQVFKDMSGFELKAGDVVSISSTLETSACGQGGSFGVGDQWIMFATAQRTPFEDIFDDTLCDLNGADFRTDTCSGNVFEPTKVDVRDIAVGCSMFT